MRKCKKNEKCFNLQKYFIFIFKGYKFDITGTYFFRVLNSEQNKTNPRSLDQKLREELSMGRSSNFGDFLEWGSNGGD